MCIAKAQQQGNLALQVKTLEAVEAGGLAGAVDGPFQRAGVLLVAQDHGQRGIARAARRRLARRSGFGGTCQAGLDLQQLVNALAVVGVLQLVHGAEARGRRCQAHIEQRIDGLGHLEAKAPRLGQRQRGRGLGQEIIELVELVAEHGPGLCLDVLVEVACSQKGAAAGSDQGSQHLQRGRVQVMHLVEHHQVVARQVQRLALQGVAGQCMAAVAFGVVQRVAAVVDAAALVLEEQAGQAVVEQILLAETRQSHAFLGQALGQQRLLGAEVEVPEGVQIQIAGLLEQRVGLPGQSLAQRIMGLAHTGLQCHAVGQKAGSRVAAADLLGRPALHRGDLHLGRHLAHQLLQPVMEGRHAGARIRQHQNALRLAAAAGLDHLAGQRRGLAHSRQRSHDGRTPLMRQDGLLLAREQQRLAVIGRKFQGAQGHVREI